MTASAWSVALSGIDGHMVEVETAEGNGLPRTVLVGLPDAALHEAKERVRAAMAASGLPWPKQLLTINLSPAGLPKNGTHYDLAIAAATLAVQGELPDDRVRRHVFLGEVGLDGRVRKVRGLLPALLSASRSGFERAVVPASQHGEAALVPGLQILPVTHLAQLRDALTGHSVADLDPEPAEPEPSSAQPDLADVHGHLDGKWALEVAAAGRHHVYLHGAPGVGKTMLASRLPSILPELEGQEAIEVSAIHSLAGVDIGARLLTRPPYADPHHSSTLPSLVGGGGKDIRPGAISLAHRGVLFLDEAPEFGSAKLDSLRTPLEAGWVTIGRATQRVRFPAQFQLVMAANPCPCGNAGVVGQECRCTPLAVVRYQERISGPILDRIDIRHHMLPVRRSFLGGGGTDRPESSAAVLDRVAEARSRQRRRLAGTPWHCNGEVAGQHLRKDLPPPTDLAPLEKAIATGGITARGADKCLRLAWTMCDLAGRDRPNATDVRAAMQMRLGDQAVRL